LLLTSNITLLSNYTSQNPICYLTVIYSFLEHRYTGQNSINIHSAVLLSTRLGVNYNFPREYHSAKCFNTNPYDI